MHQEIEARLETIMSHQQRANELLLAILSVLRGDGDTPPPVLKDLDAQTPLGEKVETPPTLDDLRAAFLPFREEHGTETAIALVKKIAGPVENISRVPPDKYPEIIAALKTQKEAA